MAKATGPLQRGVDNLVQNCAEVQSGESVLLINEQDAMDAEVVGLIEEAIRAIGAGSQAIWAPAVGRGAPLPDDIVKAIGEADKVIASYSVNAKALQEVLGPEPRVIVVQSMFRTKEHFTLEHARYHWGMARAIYERFQNELFAEGRKWRFTSPGGTDISGAIAAFSERARQLEDDLTPFCRSFNSPAYIPVASRLCEGQAVIEYTDGFRRVPIDHPPTLIVENNVITRVEGGPEASRWVSEYTKTLEERAAKLQVPDANKIDSWHGGLHPAAECTGGERGLIGNASPKMAHFHVGPDGAHMAAQWGDTSMWLDDEPVFVEGKYSPEFEDFKLQETAYQFGLKSWRADLPGAR